MAQLQGFDFFALRFDADGKLQNGDAWVHFKQQAQAGGATDAIFVAHGFRNDDNDAQTLYSEFLRTFRQNMGRSELGGAFAARKFLVAGIFWPAKSFRESFGTDGGGVLSADENSAELEAARQQLEELRDESCSPEQQAKIDEAIQLLPALEGNVENQDQFVDLVLPLVDDGELDPTEGLQQIRAQAGSELLDKLRFPVILPTAAAAEDEGGVASVRDAPAAGAFDEEGRPQGFVSFFGSALGRVGQFLNLTTWYQMKNRCGVVGANGVARAVRELRQSSPAVRIHLVGHSLGGRLMASCAKSLAQPPVVQVDSLTLLQAAFSHFGFSADNRSGTPGYFREVVAKQVVKGPMVATFSFQDSVVGNAYAIASRLAGDNVRAIGDRNDPYGGMGRNGAQNLTEFAEQRLQLAGTPYRFRTRTLHCLDGSGGLITDHGDVKNENVTWAFASAVADT
jgi:hypothetical protein